MLREQYPISAEISQKNHELNYLYTKLFCISSQVKVKGESTKWLEQAKLKGSSCFIYTIPSFPIMTFHLFSTLIFPLCQKFPWKDGIFRYMSSAKKAIFNCHICTKIFASVLFPLKYEINYNVAEISRNTWNFHDFILCSLSQKSDNQSCITYNGWRLIINACEQKSK